jgi:TPR repeat protein
MLSNGAGVKKDEVQAYKWFLIAAERGEADNKLKADAALSGMQNRLTAEQTAAARNQATAWLNSRQPAYPGHLR